MTYDALDYIGGTIILGLFIGPVMIAILVQALTFVTAVIGHSSSPEPRANYIRIKQNAYDEDEDR